MLNQQFILHSVEKLHHTKVRRQLTLLGGRVELQLPSPLAQDDSYSSERLIMNLTALSFHSTT